MLAVVFTPEGRRIEDVPEPVPGPTDVLLRVEYCGICGSDLHAAEPQFHRGTTLGHEFVGTVVEAGRKVVGFTTGDRVAIWADRNMACQDFSCANVSGPAPDHGSGRVYDAGARPPRPRRHPPTTAGTTTKTTTTTMARSMSAVCC